MASNQLHMEIQGAPISELTIKDGKVAAIGFNAPAWHFIDFAQKMIASAAGNIPHMQRPLQRKLDTVVNKMADLARDMQAHQEYCKERQLDKKFERMMASGRWSKMMAQMDD